MFDNFRASSRLTLAYILDYSGYQIFQIIRERLMYLNKQENLCVHGHHVLK